MAGKRLKRICAAARDRPVYIKAGIAAVVSVLCCAGLYMWGETEEDVEIRISGRTYTEEELDQAFERAKTDLQEYILNGNKSPDEVRTALSLITEVPDTGIRVSWEMDRYDVIDLQGNIIAEELTEEGTVVQLKAILTYEGRQQVCEFGVRVLPQILGEEEELIRSIREEAGKADGENRSEKYMILPDRAGRNPGRSGSLSSGSAGHACSLCRTGRRKKRKKNRT